MTERKIEDFIPRKKLKTLLWKNEIARGSCKGGDPMSEAGNYYLGPISQKGAKSPILRCMARKKGTDDYYLMKMLLVDDSETSDRCSFVRRAAFHNEYTFLTLMKDNPGVIQICDFFKEYIYQENSDKSKPTKLKRICMVLECVVPHAHKDIQFIPLYHYLKKDRLSEIEALYIFYNILLVLEDLHKKNIVHTNLKMANILLNIKTLKVKLLDFYCAKRLATSSEIQLGQDISTLPSMPDALTGLPVVPKAVDMWAAGAILYEMLKGSMPFTDTSNNVPWTSSGFLRDLYVTIIRNDCFLSNNTFMSDGTKELLKKILWETPGSSLEVSEAVDLVSTLLTVQCTSQNPSLLAELKCSDQVVPVCPSFDSNDQKESVEPPNKKLHITEPSRNKQEAFKDAQTQENCKKAPDSPKSTQQQNNLLNRQEIKYAMMRLGVTSVNSINALAFNYSKKNSCQL